jgi:amino acid transporter
MQPSRRVADPRRQNIGLLQLVGQSLSIGPLIDVALFLGIVASLAGAIGPLAVLLASLGMIAFSLVVAFYAAETGGAGGVGDYIERAWGKTAGIAVLGIYVMSLIFSGAGGFGIAVGELVANFAEMYVGFDVPWWAGAGLLALVALWLNLRGADAATQAQLVIVSVSVIPFLITAIAVVIRPEAENTLSVFAWNNAHGGDLFSALLFCILLFGGFETVAALGAETTDPRRNIPIALVGTVSLTAVILVFCSYAGTIYYGPQHVAKDWGGVIDGYAVIAHEVVGPWAAIWIRLAVLVDFTATCIGFSLAASRGILSLARRGLLPQSLARTNQRGAPAAAATVIFAMAILFILGGLFISADRRFKTLFVAGTAQALLLVLVYTGLALGALRLMQRSSSRQPAWRWIIFPAAAVVPLLALYGTFVPFPAFPERYGLHAGLLTLCLAAGWAVRVGSTGAGDRSEGPASGSQSHGSDLPQ